MCEKITKLEQLPLGMKSPMAQYPIGEEASTYYVEIMSECNLKCVMCGFGSRELFQRKTGKMDMELFCKIIDEIARRSPHAMVNPYHHCEPLLHPDLPKMVQKIKEHGFICEISTNLNYINGLQDLLKARPDAIDISVSGFYQHTYEKNHVGGNIENVKNNMRKLRQYMDELKIYPEVHIMYHMYKDNLLDDYDGMKRYVESLGFVFIPYWSRSIGMEMSLKYLRERGYSRYTGETVPWFDEIPSLTEAYNNGIDRMVYLPEDYLQGKWKNVWFDECILNNNVVNIRWTGKMSLCCGAFDDRFSVYDYLTTPIEKLYELRRNSYICKECRANNYMFYTNYYDMDNIDKIAQSRLPETIAADRRFFGLVSALPDELIVFCKKHKRLFIYGAGDYGHRLEKFLKVNEIAVEDFVISEDRIDEKTNIRSVKELMGIKDENIGVVIAMSNSNRMEISKNLCDLMVDTIWVGDSFFEKQGANE